jgi:ppGpp synthetase/RelA/SpoT-type nucleotidyltranferase
MVIGLPKMHEQEYKAVHLQIAGDKSIPHVLQMLRDCKLTDLCYAYKIRNKPEAKLIEKVRRKKEEKPDYALESITDVVGLRLVALFRSEMVDIVNAVLSAITHSNGINPNPFLKGQPLEMIIYKGTNAFDELAPRLKEVASKLCPGLDIKEEHSKAGYSSVHLVTHLAMEVEKFPGYKIPIEIQIRSVFEDAWGEIDHKYGYVNRTGKNAGKPINNPESVLAHLKVLKRFADACMEYADVIKTEAVGIAPELLATRKVVSVVSDNFIVDRFKVLDIQNSLIEKYCEARDLKDKAANQIDNGHSQGIEFYLNAAELFRELVAMVDEDCPVSEMPPSTKLFYYYIRMNEAICLLSTNERDQVVAALSIYQSLEDNYPEYPLLKMRYGQALGKLGYLDEAIKFLRESGEGAEKISKDYVGRNPADWPDLLPYTDYDHIIRTQPKLLGYHLWLSIRSNDSLTEEQKALLYKEAYEITSKGLIAVSHTREQELSIHNNLLYYALGCFSRANVLQIKNFTKADTLRNQIIEHVKYIEEQVPDIKSLPISRTDTIMKAYSILGQQVKATSVATILLEKCLNQPPVELSDKETLQLTRTAFQVKNGQKLNIVD